MIEHTNSLSRTASWVVVDKATRAAIFETFLPHVAAAINTTKYEAVPILAYLQSLNKR
jgi:hypothetical protein